MFVNNWGQYKGHEHLEAIFDVRVVHCYDSLRNVTHPPETK
jgi:hypothetical protein